MLKSNCKKAIENIRAYIIDNFDSTNYKPEFDYIDEAIKNGKSDYTIFTMIAHAIDTTFYREYCEHNNQFLAHHISKQQLFENWCSGLPSILDTCYYYNRLAVDDLAKILEETEEEKEKYTETQAEKWLTWLIYREIYKIVK